jgi:hypothetical protein
MKRLRRYRIFLSLPLTIALFIAYALLYPVQAHNPTGGIKIWVNDQKVGPYILLVATYPQPVTVGQQVDVWVRVGEDGANRLLRDAVVTIEAKPQNGDLMVTAPATHELAGNAFDYLAHLNLDTAGQWDFIVYVDSDLGQVHVAFTETVGWLSPKLLFWVAISIMILALIFAVYLRRQSAAMTSQPAEGEQR